MFPPAGAEIFTNEVGEPTGWDNPAYDEPEYCDICGGNCPQGACRNDSYGELDAAEYDAPSEEDEEPPIKEFDPGPEVDDEGGMSDRRYELYGPGMAEEFPED